jgi:hypothetical protein
MGNKNDLRKLRNVSVEAGHVQSQVVVGQQHESGLRRTQPAEDDGMVSRQEIGQKNLLNSNGSNTLAF